MKKIKIGTVNFNVCEPNFSKNITIQNNGEVLIKLGDAFQPPLNLSELIASNSTQIYSIFRLEVYERLGKNKSIGLNKNLKW